MSLAQAIETDAAALVACTSKTALIDKVSDLKKEPQAIAILTRAHQLEAANGNAPDMLKLLITGMVSAAKAQGIELLTCPGCNTPNFSPAGLKAHRCKGIKREAVAASVEVTTDNPTPAVEDPRWLAVRETSARLRDAGRTYLEMQAWLGWQLAQLKKDFDVKRGRPNKSAESADLRTWDDLVKHYTGYSRRTADVLIQLFDASKAKLKRVAKKPEEKNALAIFNQGNPLALPPDQREKVRDVIASLCTGETQGSLMAELGITPKPVMPAKTPPANPGGQQHDQLELAFHHWDGPASALVKACSPEGLKYLHLLPPVTDEPGKLSLTFLRDQAAALVAEAEAALAAHAKPAKGKPQSPATDH